MALRLYTSAQVRALDAHTLHTLGVPSLVLMEAAGRALAELALARFGAACAAGVQVVCGRGNNGGDGYVAARLLHLAGVPVRVLALPGPRSTDGELMARAAVGVGVPVLPLEEGLRPAGLVIDAVLGTGLQEAVRGPAAEAIARMNQRGLPILAADIPSGLCGDTGRVLGEAVRARLTACLGRPKLGLLLEPGADHAGELVDVDIGLVDPTPPLPPVALAPDGPWVAARLPPRRAASHKGSFGHLAVVAGSPDRAGAAVLCSLGALHSGVGLVTLFIDGEALPRLGALPPEVMVRRCARPGPWDLAGFQAAAVGPGFGTEPERQEVLRRLWAEAALPAVFDADGLTALGPNAAASPHPRAITPHPREAGRLLGLDAAQVQADRLGAVQALGRLAPALLKGRHTLISGEPPLLNRTGSPALAVGGSGDVLTGLVGGLLAQGLGAADALAVGAFWHGLAGDLLGEGPALATQIAAALGPARARIPGWGPALGAWPLLRAGA